MVQLSHPYMTTGKTIALTRWTFVGKVMSLLFNMQSRLVIAFLSRSKRLLISWLQSPSAVILEPPKIKSVTLSIASPSICHEEMELDAMILVFWVLSFKPTFHSWSWWWTGKPGMLLSMGLQRTGHDWAIWTALNSFLILEPVLCSMSGSSCCFLTCKQISQEAGYVVLYSHLFKTFSQFIEIHRVKGFSVVN